MNVRPQRQQGRWTVDVRVPLGDITSDELRQVARLAREHGNGTVRATNDQNLVLPSVATTSLPGLHAAFEDLGLGDPDVHTITDVVSCPGMDYCSLAITRSMGVAERIRTALMRDPATGNGFAAELGAFTVKISGCPNSCGQHHVGNIGLTGHSVTEDDGSQHPYYSILAGGSVGEDAGRIGVRVGRFREEQTPGAIAALAKLYAAERAAGESFADFAERVGQGRLTETAEAGARGA
jgi:sulfite reductase beta subunit-like hemoprotein